MMNDSYWGMGTFGWLVMVAFWVLLIVGILWALRELRTGSAPPEPPEPASEDPLSILDRRLASGDIDAQTYDELRDKLAEGRLLRR